MTWLLNLFAPILTYLGIPLPQRYVIDFEGGGVTVVDDPTKSRTVVTVAGSSQAPVTITSASSPYQAVDGVPVRVDSTSGSVEVIVPAAAGQMGLVKWIAGSHAVTIAATVGNIDGAATQTLSTLYSATTTRGNGAGADIWA